ncbi:hypothetical protein C7M84_004159, partial [Penaeus vannamei]
MTTAKKRVNIACLRKSNRELSCLWSPRISPGCQGPLLRTPPRRLGAQSGRVFKKVQEDRATFAPFVTDRRFLRVIFHSHHIAILTIHHHFIILTPATLIENCHITILTHVALSHSRSEVTMKDPGVKLDLYNYDLPQYESCPYILTSPRSLEACKRLGIKPVELLQKSREEFQAAHPEMSLEEALVAFHRQERNRL